MKHKYIFIGGLHRSGTTMLAEMLALHKDISGFENTGVPENEGQHLQSVMKPALAYGGPGDFAFDRSAHLTEKSELNSVVNKQKLNEEWNPHWDLKKKYLLEKSPPNLIRFRLLQALYPDSYMILILRHPVAVSIATSKWNKKGLDHLFSHWLHAHGVFAGDLPYLKRIHIVRYRELTTNPDQTMQAIFNFLELKPAPVKYLVNPDINKKYFADWQSKKERHPAETASLIAKYSGKFSLYGYNID